MSDHSNSPNRPVFSAVEMRTQYQLGVNAIIKDGILTAVGLGRRFTLKAPTEILSPLLDIVSSGPAHVEDLLAALPSHFNRQDAQRLVRAMIDACMLIDVQSAALLRLRPNLRAEELIADREASLSENVKPTDCQSFRLPVKDEALHQDTFSKWSEIPIDQICRLQDTVTRPVLMQLLHGAYTATGGGAPRNITGTADGGTSANQPAATILRHFWIQIRNGTGISPGFYEIEFPADRAIRFLKYTVSPDLLHRIFADPTQMRDAAGCLLICANLGPAIAEHGNRAAIIASIAAGHIFQRLEAAARSQNIAVCQISNIDENGFKYFGFKATIIPLAAVAVGISLVSHYARQSWPQPAVAFRWLEIPKKPYRPPFHIATARLTFNEFDSGWCWGRSDNAQIAFIKAVTEAIERLACSVPLNVQWSTPSREGNFLGPENFVRYSSKQYADGNFPFVPFDPGCRYPLVTISNLHSSQRFKILADLVYYQDSLRDRHRRPYTSASTSGVAAHTSYDKAIESATLEVLERDAFMRVWAGALVCETIHNESLPDPLRCRVEDLIEFGWTVTIQVMTKEPVLSILVVGRNDSDRRTVVAASAGFEIGDAVEHALGELELLLAVKFSTGEDHSARKPAEKVRNPEDHGDLYLDPEFFDLATSLLESKAKLSYHETISVAKTWSELVEYMQQNNREIYIHDQSLPIEMQPAGVAPVYVVRALMPSCIPIYFGFGLQPKIDNMLGLGYNPERWVVPHPFA